MLAGRRIAIVEDDEIMGASLVQRLEIEGARPTWWRRGADATAALRAARASFDAVVCDIRLPDRDGEAVFRETAAAGSPPPFLFITAYGDIDQAVRLLRSGGGDYLTKPFAIDVFLARLAAIARSPDDVAATGALGVSAAMRAIEDTLGRIAGSDLPVLIFGETGVGKEIAARLLHACSPRAAEPFVAVNCAAIPGDLLESEVFGHERGAFTGAVARHAGHAERARAGTLFLDEIGDMPLHMQAKLLRLIEDGFFLRVGGESPVPFRARVVSASHQDLEAAAAAGRFRRDLLYRLNTVTVAIPPLRARPDDAVWLLRRFFQAATEARPGSLRGIGPLAEEVAAAHPWPGNVRELRNRVERAVALARGPVLTPADLFPEQAEPPSGSALAPLHEVRDAAERRQIMRALDETGGRIGEAARRLGISRTTLWEKMQRLGV
jgi:two-component system, NtrC family, response regulator HydG